MPGLFGLRRETNEPVEGEALLAMADAMRHGPKLVSEQTPLPGFGAGRVHLGVFQPAPQPHVDAAQRLHVWIDGEITDREVLARRFGLGAAPRGDAALVAALHERAGLGFLHEADGTFQLAIYDARSRELVLASDRHGLRPLFFATTGDGFAFAAEVKALLALPGFPVQIDPEAVLDWFGAGQLLGDRTWIRGVEVLPPATILRVGRGGISRERYFRWSGITPLSESADESECAEELGRRWLRAVWRRVDANPLGQQLSGGLDSRAILAAVPDDVRPYPTLTFGRAGCDDARIARRAAKRRRVPHHFFELREEGWLAPRLDALWRTDGLVPILDLHGCEALPTLSDLCRVQLHGYLGDATVGGSYLGPSDPDDYLLARLHRRGPLAPSDEEALGRLRALWESSRAPLDRFLVDQRGRRFVLHAVAGTGSFLEVRLPFFDRDFLDLVYAMPDRWRADSRIYDAMLLRFFPDLYRKIPWQKTGLPLGAPPWRRRAHRVRLRAEGVMRRLGLPVRGRAYTDYPRWLRAEPARSFATDLLLDPEALHPSHVDGEAARKTVRAFFAGQDADVREVGLLLGFEIYLRRLFDREGLDEIARVRLV